jgi:hypothetical protein
MESMEIVVDLLVAKKESTRKVHHAFKSEEVYWKLKSWILWLK